MKQGCTRYASPLLKTSDNHILKGYGVELYCGVFSRHFKLDEELESTSWLDGMIELEEEDHFIVAYHLTPYDCINEQPVDETQRIRLK